MAVTCTDDGPDDVVDDDANEDYGQLSKKESKQQVIIQFPWDHGGSKLLHRLGGKPKLKKGGMSVYALGSMGRRVLSPKF